MLSWDETAIYCDLMGPMKAGNVANVNGPVGLFAPWEISKKP